MTIMIFSVQVLFDLNIIYTLETLFGLNLTYILSIAEQSTLTTLRALHCAISILLLYFTSIFHYDIHVSFQSEKGFVIITYLFSILTIL